LILLVEPARVLVNDLVRERLRRVLAELRLNRLLGYLCGQLTYRLLKEAVWILKELFDSLLSEALVLVIPRQDLRIGPGHKAKVALSVARDKLLKPAIPLRWVPVLGPPVLLLLLRRSGLLLLPHPLVESVGVLPILIDPRF